MKTTPFDYSNHPMIVKYMFEGGNTTGYKVLYYLESQGLSAKNLSIRALAKAIDSKPSSVFRALKELQKKKLITVNERTLSVNS